MNEQVAKRECGKCTLCCKLIQVNSLDKPQGKWCEYCKTGKGCTIYSVRPEDCRTFKCLWLMDERLPDTLRPDKSHVVLSATRDGNKIVAHQDVNRPNAYKTGEIGEWIEGMSKLIDIIVVTGNKRVLLTTKKEEPLIQLARS